MVVVKVVGVGRHIPATTAGGEYVPRATRRALPDALGEDEVIVEGRRGGDAETVCVAVAVEDREGHEVPGDAFNSFVRVGSVGVDRVLW